MKKETLAVVVTAAVMLSACCSCESHEETEATGVTEDTTASETSETSASETTGEEQTGSVRDGLYVTFGRYEQDGNEDNGPEPIKWKILAEEDGKMLLISKYSLSYQPYNEVWTEVTWETCTLRQWLNDDFYNDAFNAAEQELILTTTVSNHDNTNFPAWGVVDGGNDTEDKVYLLSYEEADLYFSSDYERATTPCEWWWLRSPGFKPTHAAVVIETGEIYTKGHNVNFNSNDHGVRPVIWISVEE